MKYIKDPKRIPIMLFSAPIIYLFLIPGVILDIYGEIAHRICFPLWKVPYVKRSEYIKIDRQKLKYLNWIQKINCMYCGYANGLLAYWTELVAQTERYWCGIQHKNDPNFHTPKHHEQFAKYDDKKDFENKYK